MQSLSLDRMLPVSRDHTVHLCLDMQRLFAPGGIWSTPWLTRVTPQIVKVAELMGARNVFTRFIPPKRYEDAPGMWQPFYKKWLSVTRQHLASDALRLIPELEHFAPPCTLFDKAGYSAFHDGRLHNLLQERHVHTLIVTGAETDVCVLSTVLNAIDYGYRVILAEDALCSSSDTGHDALMAMYRERLFIQLEIAVAAEVVEALNKS